MKSGMKVASSLSLLQKRFETDENVPITNKENVPVFQSSAFKLKYHYFFNNKKHIFKIIYFDLYYLIIFWGNIYINGNRRLPWSMATKTLPKCKSYMYVKFAILSCFYGRILSCFFLFQNQPFHG